MAKNDRVTKQTSDKKDEKEIEISFTKIDCPDQSNNYCVLLNYGLVQNGLATVPLLKFLNNFGIYERRGDAPILFGN
jgi:hypothetical protein